MKLPIRYRKPLKRQKTECLNKESSLKNLWNERFFRLFLNPFIISLLFFFFYPHPSFPEFITFAAL